jgi:DNA polymerase-1
MDVIKEKPDHLAVAFDNGGSQLRNEIFQNIKRTVIPRSDKIAVPTSITEGDAYPYY